jgi:hypothetical protein
MPAATDPRGTTSKNTPCAAALSAMLLSASMVRVLVSCGF